MTHTPEKPAPALPAFTPVPRLQRRRDGWAPAVQQAFIEALADTGSVEAACRMVDKSPASAYRLRRHPEGDEFAAAWQAAVDFGIQRIEDFATDRAINGVEVPVFAYGDKIATRRVHNESLVMFMLRNRRPERYCSDGARALNAIDKRQLERLKKQWHAEWLAQDQEDEKEAHDAIDAWLENMRTNRLNNMTPRLRAAWEEYQRIEAEEKANPTWPDDDWDDDDDDDPPLIGGPEPQTPDGPEPMGPDKPKPRPEPGIRTLKDDGWG